VTHRDPSPPSSWSLSSLGLYLVLFAAALLRFWSLGAHLPFSPGVDEPEVMERAVRMMKTGDLNPHFFDYPSLYIYVEGAVSTVRFLVGATQGLWNGLGQAQTEAFYLWGRAVTAIFGTASVWVVHRAGLYWGRRTALIAAVMLAVMPLHVRASHYTLTDVPATFFVLVTLLLSLRTHERSTLWSFALAGAAAGLAGATKYNAGLAVIMPLVACVMTPAARPSRGLAAIWVVAGAMIAFLIAAPYTLLDLPNFLNGFAQLASEYRAPANTTNPGWFVYLKLFRSSLQWPASLIVLAGLVLGCVRTALGPDRLKWTLPVAFSLLYFFFVSHQNIYFGRYLLPMVPSLTLLGAAAIVWIIDAMRQRSVPAAARQAVTALVTLFVIVPPAYTSIAGNTEEGRVWTTEQAYRWIVANVPKGSTIYIEGSVTFQLPADYKSTHVVQLRRKGDAASFKRGGVEYLVASSQQFGLYADSPDEPSKEYRDYQRLFDETQELARFTPSAEHPGPELRILHVQ
jgi:4-amino-4-deoxy-L-arabinose transferase-like glycosyltransferase